MSASPTCRSRLAIVHTLTFPLLTLFACCFGAAFARAPRPCIGSVPYPDLLDSTVSFPISPHYNLTLFPLDPDPHAPSNAFFNFSYSAARETSPPPIPVLIFVVESSGAYYKELQFVDASDDDQRAPASSPDTCDAKNQQAHKLVDNTCFDSSEAENMGRSTNFTDYVFLEFHTDAPKPFVRACRHQQSQDFDFAVIGCVAIPQHKGPLTVLVGFITPSDATIRVTPSAPLPPSLDSSTPQKSHSHNMIVVWILVASVSLTCLGGFMILVVYINRYKRHPRSPSSTPQVSRPRLFTGEPVQRDLESSEMPMIHSPPFAFRSDNAFQVPTSTVSWMKEPSPR